jgi:pimeloyl-ACP methyl ester carboxylesterase
VTAGDIAATTTAPDGTTIVPSDEPQPADDGTFVAGPCPFAAPDGFEVECGTLVVPEDRTDPDSPALDLAVAVVRAPAGGAEPIVYLAGGPGGSGIDDFLADPEGWEYPFTRDRDLVLLDQRGTGYSIPTLDCPEVTDMDPADDPERVCHERLVTAGIDIGAYSTRENAADVAALRTALGIERWNVLGISYGTRLALEVMRLDADGIRAVVLDSPFPPDVDVPVDEVYATTGALDALYADCARDEYCGTTYPDLERVFLDTVARLNAEETAGIFGDDLVIAVQNAFTATELVPLVPWVIYEVAGGNLDAVDEIAPAGGAARAGFQAGVDRSDAEGMYLSVMCNDEYAVGDYERVESIVVGTIPVELEGILLQSAFELTATCEYWSPREVVDNTPVTSDLPTLILVGQYDVATPPAWGRLAAASLRASYLYEFPGGGHSLLGGVECAIAVADAFLSDPTAAPDAGCIEEIVWPWFE